MTILHVLLLLMCGIPHSIVGTSLDWDPRCQTALDHISAGSIERAEEAWKAEVGEPNTTSCPYATGILGILYSRTGRLKEGMTLLTHASRIDPDDWVSLSYLAAGYELIARRLLSHKEKLVDKLRPPTSTTSTTTTTTQALKVEKELKNVLQNAVTLFRRAIDGRNAYQEMLLGNEDHHNPNLLLRHHHHHSPSSSPSSTTSSSATLPPHTSPPTTTTTVPQQQLPFLPHIRFAQQPTNLYRSLGACLLWLGQSEDALDDDDDRRTFLVVEEEGKNEHAFLSASSAAATPLPPPSHPLQTIEETTLDTTSNYQRRQKEAADVFVEGVQAQIGWHDPLHRPADAHPTWLLKTLQLAGEEELTNKGSSNDSVQQKKTQKRNSHITSIATEEGKNRTREEYFLPSFFTGKRRRIWRKRTNRGNKNRTSVTTTIQDENSVHDSVIVSTNSDTLHHDDEYKEDPQSATPTTSSSSSSSYIEVDDGFASLLDLYKSHIDTFRDELWDIVTNNLTTATTSVPKKEDDDPRRDTTKQEGISRPMSSSSSSSSSTTTNTPPPPGFKYEEAGLHDTRSWTVYVISVNGKLNEIACSRVIRTCALFSSSAAFPPLVHHTATANHESSITSAIPSPSHHQQHVLPPYHMIRDGQIKFSLMTPGTHVTPHAGPTNARLRMHCTLTLFQKELGGPNATRIRVGRETRFWQDDDCFLFDESFEHEVTADGVLGDEHASKRRSRRDGRQQRNDEEEETKKVGEASTLVNNIQQSGTVFSIADDRKRASFRAVLIIDIANPFLEFEDFKHSCFTKEVWSMHHVILTKWWRDIRRAWEGGDKVWEGVGRGGGGSLESP